MEWEELIDADDDDIVDAIDPAWLQKWRLRLEAMEVPKRQAERAIRRTAALAWRAEMDAADLAWKRGRSRQRWDDPGVRLHELGILAISGPNHKGPRPWTTLRFLQNTTVRPKEFDMVECAGGCGIELIVPAGMSGYCAEHEKLKAIDRKEILAEQLDEDDVETFLHEQDLRARRAKRAKENPPRPRIEKGDHVLAHDRDNFGTVLKVGPFEAEVLFWNKERDTFAIVDLPLGMLTVQ